MDRMTPDASLDRIVEIRDDDGWFPGVLHHWRQKDGRWEGWCRWTVGVGMQKVGWVDEGDLREASGL